MTLETKPGCGRPVVKNEVVEEASEVNEVLVEKKGEQRMIKVGKPAPMFKAAAYYNGDFTEVNLEDYKGKWVVLCFYPGDFTFV